MDAGSQWAIIVALAGTLSGVVAWVGRRMDSEIKELKTALIEANKATAAANAMNQALYTDLANRWLNQQQADTTPPTTSGKR